MGGHPMPGTQAPPRGGMPPPMGGPGPMGPSMTQPGGQLPPGGAPRPGGMPGSMPGSMPGQQFNRQPQPGLAPGLNQPQGPHGGGPGGPFGGSNQNQRRTLDPDQMPSPIQVMEEDQRNSNGYFDTREKGQPPPLVTTNFITRDFGNASPRFIRSTMYYVPATEDMRKQTGVPFGIVLSPLAKVAKDEIEPPVTDFGPSGINCTVWKNDTFTFTEKISREIYFLVTSSVKRLLSRTCQKSVLRVNFLFFVKSIFAILSLNKLLAFRHTVFRGSKI